MRTTDSGGSGLPTENWSRFWGEGQAIHFISNDCKSDSEIWKAMLKEVDLRGRIW
jgi:hypothetical protein